MDKQEQKKERVVGGKRFLGKVVSINTAKTAKVDVPHVKKHHVYRKPLMRSKRYTCHCEHSDISVGDTVEICQTKPISRTKHFLIIRKVENGRNV